MQRYRTSLCCRSGMFYRMARTLSRMAKLGEKAVTRSNCAQNRNILFKCPRWSYYGAKSLQSGGAAESSTWLEEYKKVVERRDGIKSLKATATGSCANRRRARAFWPNCMSLFCPADPRLPLSVTWPGPFAEGRSDEPWSFGVARMIRGCRWRSST